MTYRLLLLSLFVLVFSGCTNVYYDAMETIGIHKRDIMVDRVEEARDSQEAAKEQFVTAMEQFKDVVNFQGGDLEKEYNRFSATLRKSEARAEDVRSRIRSVEEVSQALFEEWRTEIQQYSSNSLRKASQRKYDLTKRKYTTLITAMKRAEAKMEPALIPLRDQVLFMKHNLNARAIAGLSSELVSVQTNVDRLVRDMERAIAQADEFIGDLMEE